MNRTTLLRLALAATVTLAGASAMPANADEDGAYTMCMMGDEAAVCECASKALREEIGDEDFATYSAIGVDYVARRDAGENMVDAWNDATDGEAERLGTTRSALQKRTNVMGRAHRDAIKACKGVSS